MKRYITACVAGLVLLAGCSDTIHGKSIAEPQVDRFHALLKASDFEGMYSSTSEDLKASAPKEKVIALFAAIDRKLGPLQESKEINWNVNTNNMVTTVVLVYESKFRDGEATETFTFRVSDKKAEMIGYNIASLDMLIK